MSENINKTALHALHEERDRLSGVRDQKRREYLEVEADLRSVKRAIRALMPTQGLTSSEVQEIVELLLAERAGQTKEELWQAVSDRVNSLPGKTRRGLRKSFDKAIESVDGITT